MLRDYFIAFHLVMFLLLVFIGCTSPLRAKSVYIPWYIYLAEWEKRKEAFISEFTSYLLYLKIRIKNGIILEMNAKTMNL